MTLRRTVLALVPALVWGCAGDVSDDPLAPDALRVQSAQEGAAAAANGGAHWTIPPEVFGVEVENRLAFTARRDADGTVTGRIEYHQLFLEFHIILNARVTCMTVWDGGTRVKYGGVVEASNDPDLPPGEVFIWFQGIDNGESAGSVPDRSTIAGAGDEAANESFCADPAGPRNAFDVVGNIQVSG
jgi:hypothetical protein